MDQSANKEAPITYPMQSIYPHPMEGVDVKDVSPVERLLNQNAVYLEDLNDTVARLKTQVSFVSSMPEEKAIDESAPGIRLPGGSSRLTARLNEEQTQILRATRGINEVLTCLEI